MTLFDAAELLLVYAKLPEVQISALIKTLRSITTDDEINTLKSIRFENDNNKMHGIISNALKSAVLNISDLKEDGSISTGAVYTYTIRDDKSPRLVIYSADIAKSLAVRLFTKETAFNRFKNNSKIKVTDAFEFNGFEIISYLADKSNITRYAVLMEHTAVMDKIEIINKLKEINSAANVTTADVSTDVKNTSFFNV